MKSEIDDVDDLKSFASMDAPEQDQVESEIVEASDQVDFDRRAGEVKAADDIMDVQEFSDMARMAFDMPQTVDPDWQPFGITPEKEAGFMAACEAAHNLLAMSPFGRKLLTRNMSVLGNVLTLGSFLYVQLICVKMVLAEKQAKAMSIDAKENIPASAAGHWPPVPREAEKQAGADNGGI